MYNRYIPQSDGTYRKNRVPEPGKQSPRAPAPKKPVSCPEPEQEPYIPCPQVHTPPPRPCYKKPRSGYDSITGFFKNLLPKEMDTADLLIIVLLLLMAGDCEDDRNNALLTLALYFLL